MSTDEFFSTRWDALFQRIKKRIQQNPISEEEIELEVDRASEEYINLSDRNSLEIY
jgi:uncharacterized protein YpuA (DUF1002 family)